MKIGVVKDFLVGGVFSATGDLSIESLVIEDRPAIAMTLHLPVDWECAVDLWLLTAQHPQWIGWEAFVSRGGSESAHRSPLVRSGVQAPSN